MAVGNAIDLNLISVETPVTALCFVCLGQPSSCGGGCPYTTLHLLADGGGNGAAAADSVCELLWC
mgnify:CR=1 FL=1|jgi:hypothetical protein